MNTRLEYDEEAKVWFVAESDVPGLSLEAESREELVARVAAVTPDLLHLNSGD